MAAYLNPAFYAAVCVLYCGLQWRPARLNRTTWFGILNALALVAIFGPKAASIVLAFTIALWLSLHGLRSLPAGSKRQVLEITIYSVVTVAFIFHKLAPVWIAAPPTAQPPASGGAQAIAALLETIAFSYIYLRTLDSVRVVAAGGTLLNPAGLSGYLIPFFMIPAGPVNVYADHIKIDTASLPPPAWRSFIACADTVTSGLFLKFVVAEIWKLYFIGLSGIWPTGTFQDSAVIFVYVHFDFFGYSLVALGIGRLLGIPTPVNFKAPFLSVSVTEFWTRWHISLGNFVRRGLFIPLQVAMVRRFGRDWAYATNLVALTLSFGFVGLWHRFTWTFVAWGFFVGFVVALEKVARDRWIATKASKLPAVITLQRVLGPIYVFLVIVGTLHFAIPELMGQTK
jgi:D-alanyl-lipoteichoic acid acyltransferase DltB (MBOAT superfamily)